MRGRPNAAPSQATVGLITPNPAIERSLRILLESGGLEARSYDSVLPLLHSPALVEETCIVLDSNAALPEVSLEDILIAVRGSKLVILLAETADLSSGVRHIMDEVFDLFEMPFSPAALIDSVREALSLLSGPDIVGARGGTEALTDRERQVLARLVQGESAKLIGKALGISPRTVEAHRARIMYKFSARNLADLVRIAVQSGDEPPHRTGD